MEETSKSGEKQKETERTQKKRKERRKKLYIPHWCIKPLYNVFAIAIECTLKVVPFGFWSVQVMPLFRISFWLPRRSDKNLTCSNLRLFGILTFLRLIYILHSHQALKLQWGC